MTILSRQYDPPIHFGRNLFSNRTDTPCTVLPRLPITIGNPIGFPFFLCTKIEVPCRNGIVIPITLFRYIHFYRNIIQKTLYPIG